MDTRGVHPVVLVGGRSTRFGSDKLLHPLGDGGVLVDRPIAALRALFGPCVTLAGNCSPLVTARGDAHLADPPDLHGGPALGIIAALGHFQAPVLVLSGDLPDITVAVVSRLIDSIPAPPLLALWAHADGPQPCVGVYFPASLERLRDRLRAGSRSLNDAFAPAEVGVVHFTDPGPFRNVNSTSDLPENAAQTGLRRRP